MTKQEEATISPTNKWPGNPHNTCSSCAHRKEGKHHSRCSWHEIRIEPTNKCLNFQRKRVWL